MSWTRRRLALLLLSLAGLAGGRASALSAQTATITIAAADTVATVADLTGAATTHVLTLGVAVSGCGSGKNCNVYMSAELTGTVAVSSIVFSRTSSTCASGSTAVTSGPTPNTAGTFIYSLTGATTGSGGGKVDASGSTTVYVCSTVTAGWTTTPYRSPYRLYFTVVRQ